MIEKVLPHVLKSLARTAANSVGRTEVCIKIIKDFGWDKKNPPRGFEDIYAYSLVEYAFEDRSTYPEELVKLLREPEIKEAFQNTLHQRDPRVIENTLKNRVNWELSGWNVTGRAVREKEIDLDKEILAFTRIYNEVVMRSLTPQERRLYEEIVLLRSSIINNESNSRNNRDLEQLQKPFLSIIKHATQDFIGREYVFEAFQSFVESKDSGYFSVVGFPGVGKTSISAQYVTEVNPDALYYFVRRGRGDRPADFLKSICAQLVEAYRLDKTVLEEADSDQGITLESILTDISKRYLESHGKKLCIVVDALDEAVGYLPKDRDSRNVFHLPESLPSGVYFFLTQRPPENNKNYNIEPKSRRGTPLHPYFLEDVKEKSREDIRQYVQNFLLKKSQGEELRERILSNQIFSRGNPIDEVSFVKVFSEIANGNFMYAKHLLPDLSAGIYSNLVADTGERHERLPLDLESYYADHWRRMNVSEDEIYIVYFLATCSEPISVNSIVENFSLPNISINNTFVTGVIRRWFQFIRELKNYEDMHSAFEIYHKSYQDFLFEIEQVKSIQDDIDMTASESYMEQVKKLGLVEEW